MNVVDVAILGTAADAVLEAYLRGAALRTVVAFVAVVLAVAIATRIVAALVKRRLSVLVLTGTVVYRLTGADLEPIRDALAVSRLTPQASGCPCSPPRSPGTRCWALRKAAMAAPRPGQPACGAKVKGLLGRDLGSVAEAVGRALDISPDEIADLAGGQGGLAAFTTRGPTRRSLMPGR